MSLLLGRVRLAAANLPGARAVLTELLAGGDVLAETPAWGELALVEHADGDRAAAWDRLAGALSARMAAGRHASAAIVCCYAADLAATEERVDLAAALLGAADAFRGRAGLEQRLPGGAGDRAEAAAAGQDEARAAGRALDGDALLALVGPPPPAA